MDHEVRIAVALREFGSGLDVGELVAGDGVHEHKPRREAGVLADVVQNSKLLQHARRVGSELESGAELGEVLGFF